MSVIILLLIISLVLAGGFLAAFFWSVSDGQFDDAYGPSRRILYQDESNKPENK
jgi:cbb3-type cytochrome oxidase maturation protein